MVRGERRAAGDRDEVAVGKDHAASRRRIDKLPGGGRIPLGDFGKGWVERRDLGADAAGLDRSERDEAGLIDVHEKSVRLGDAPAGGWRG